MHKSFQSLDELFDYLKVDKEWEGAEATMHNRYPIRFILFENFADFNEFVINRPSGVYKFSIDYLVDKNYLDIFPTFTDLSDNIKKYVKALPTNDFVIYPFSEMVRFYSKREFDSLVKTIRGYQPPEDAQLAHLRLYIPIVGMQGKMGPYMNDHQTFVWEYKSPNETGTYNLILTNGTTYGVSGLERNYSVVRNLYEWLKLWEKGSDVKKNIICISKTIFANAFNAQPDNAFVYTECDSAYKFLTKGLKLDFGGITPNEDEMPQWETLAQNIDLEDFDFETFINERFDTFNIKDSKDFIKTWFECETDFDRWLLAMYYRKISGNHDYICESLDKCINLNTSELFSNIATHIFDTQMSDENIRERRSALEEAMRHDIRITDAAERQTYAKLSAMMCGELEAKYTAIRLMTAFTDSDRCLIIESLGKGKISLSDVEKIYPELYHYMRPLSIQLGNANQWITEYFEAYRCSKIANNAALVAPLLAQKNANQSTFQHWLDNLKTVKTLLHNRHDIDKFYWIDGLGVDWIPFISYVIQKHNVDNIYLNEAYVSRAILPTTTAVNKAKLVELVVDGSKLEKIGDLDSFAHQHKDFPQYIIDEMRIVEDAVHKILTQYNGKKIAFVSDHGLTYLAQYGQGLNLAGVVSDHEGRTAVVTSGTAVSDNKYCILDDCKTLCALTEDSLTSKTSKSHGAHGGATPEEVLVPIIIVSNQPNANVYAADILTNEIDGTNPVARLKIRGLNSIDVPVLEYNSTTYSLVRESRDIFVSEKLNLVDTATRVTLHIGNYSKPFIIKISTGAEEDDLFDF